MMIAGKAKDHGPRVLVVDDHPEALKIHLAELSRRGFQWCLEETVRGGLARLREARFDLLVTDIELPDGSGIDLVRATQTLGLHIAVVIVTAYPTVATAVGALRLGALDYLIKPCSPPALADAVCAGLDHLSAATEMGRIRDEAAKLHAALDHIERAAARPPPAQPAAPPLDVQRPQAVSESLTRRESEVVELLVDGRRPREIAERLFVSPHTVRNHLKSIYKKLGVHSQIELVALAHAQTESVSTVPDG